ncbi:unnamed protein product [Ectocarpus sp. CCAP 1310/34]|nr:unnamed protein product [Ectocarpus sp. CCAP 1310/34]
MDRHRHTNRVQVFAGSVAAKMMSWKALLDTGSPASFVQESLVAFRRLWHRAPPHIRDVHFDCNAKLWEPEDVDKLGTGAEHVRDLERFFERMVKFNLKLAPNKHNLGVKVVTFLGHQVSAEGIGPDPEKIRPLRELPMPTNVSQLRSLLGSLSYYRKFLKNMSAKLKPINAVLKKGGEVCVHG